MGFPVFDFLCSVHQAQQHQSGESWSEWTQWQRRGCRWPLRGGPAAAGMTAAPLLFVSRRWAAAAQLRESLNEFCFPSYSELAYSRRLCPLNGEKVKAGCQTGTQTQTRCEPPQVVSRGPEGVVPGEAAWLWPNLRHASRFPTNPVAALWRSPLIRQACYKAANTLDCKWAAESGKRCGQMDFMCLKPVNQTLTCTCGFESAVCPGAEWLCDGGHSRRAGLSRLPNHQGLPGFSSGEELPQQGFFFFSSRRRRSLSRLLWFRFVSFVFVCVNNVIIFYRLKLAQLNIIESRFYTWNLARLKHNFSEFFWVTSKC